MADVVVLAISMLSIACAFFLIAYMLIIVVYLARDLYLLITTAFGFKIEIKRLKQTPRDLIDIDEMINKRGGLYGL